MDDRLKQYLDGLNQLCSGKADRVEAGGVTFQVICPGIIVIDLHHRLYLYLQEDFLEGDNPPAIR